jgi:hypothetical protein
MKKSSVEKTNPYSPAKAFALVDLPEPGSPLIRIRVLFGLSPYIILLYEILIDIRLESSLHCPFRTLDQRIIIFVIILFIIE